MAAHTAGPSAGPTSAGAQAQRTQALATALRRRRRRGPPTRRGARRLGLAFTPPGRRATPAPALAASSARRRGAPRSAPRADRRARRRSRASGRARAGGVQLLPDPSSRSSAHGALVVGCPRSARAAAADAMLESSLAAQIAVRLDHARLVESSRACAAPGASRRSGRARSCSSSPRRSSRRTSSCCATTRSSERSRS